ncbi:MAG: LacI family transcriptional regulator [Lachnospiraceae bacterium]|nr:LacI family transcriptional regulator [Lachnospiraceae bacterium]
MERIKTIGLVIDEIFADFSKEIMHSVLYAMRDRKDLRLIVMAGRQCEFDADNDDNQHMYKMVYNSIYTMEEPCDVDGLIVSLPNLKGVGYERYKNVPKVFIASDKKDELTVNYNDEMGLKEALDYLFRVKGITNICMLGGRDDNADAQKRRMIFMDYLREKNLDCSADLYEAAGMSTRSEAAATRLLDRNPEAQAVFCVNDQVAYGLYNVLKKRNKMPGRDIAVFGFDNTRLATDMVPALASVGADAASLGLNALNILLARMNGEPADPVTIPTCLFGRESIEYTLEGYSPKDLVNASEAYIYEMFDTCFYRYRNEIIDSRQIDLRRLYYEIVSKILACTKKRHMNDKQYEELCRLIDIFFENGAMKYTDVSRFTACTGAFQEALKDVPRSGAVNDKNSALFSRMRDKGLLAQASWWIMKNQDYSAERMNINEYIAQTMSFSDEGVSRLDNALDNFGMLGLEDAALYLYDTPVMFEPGDNMTFPDTINLKCAVVKGEVKRIPEAEQRTSSADIFNYEGLAKGGRGQVAFPVFSGLHIYGMLICGLSRDIAEKGEYIASQIGRVMSMCFDCDRRSV